MNLEKAKISFEQSKKEVGDFFGISISCNIYFNLDSEWTDFGEDCSLVAWNLGDDDLYDCEIDIVDRFDKDGYVLFIREDESYSAFDGDCYVFKLDNKIKEDLGDEDKNEDKNENIENMLNDYKKVRDEIGDFFDAPIYCNLIIETEEEWTDYGAQHDSVGWERLSHESEEEDLDDIEFNYGMEVYGTSRWEKGGYVLFVGDDGCGNRDSYIFKSDKKIEDV